MVWKKRYGRPYDISTHSNGYIPERHQIWNCLITNFKKVRTVVLTMKGVHIEYFDSVELAYYYQEGMNETYIQALNELDFQLTETKLMLEKQQRYRAQLEAEIKNHKETSHHLKSNFNDVNSFTNDYEIEINILKNRLNWIV